MKFLRLALASSLALAFAHAAPQLALGDNEELVYRVSWAIVSGAGQIRISAAAATDPAGARLQRVVTQTSTRGLAHLLLPFEARAESVFSVSSGRLLSLSESSTTRGVKDAHTVSFDYEHGVADYRDDESRRLALPDGYPTDLITCLVQARSWNLKPGETHDALVLFEDEFYELTVHAVGTQVITTPLGTFQTVVLEPRMEKTPPKGMFKRGSTVRVWVTADNQHLPVRFKVNFKFGAGVATLASYRPPLAPTPGASHQP